MEISNLNTIAVPIDLFYCPVHLDLPHNNGKLYQCIFGHLVCEECYNKLSQFPKCPTCREDMIKPSRNIIAEKALKYFEKPCPYRSKGCKVRTRQNLHHHIEHCSFKPLYFCAAIGIFDCSFDAYDPYELIHHLQTDCRHKLSHTSNEHISYDLNFTNTTANSPMETGLVHLTVKTLISPRFLLLPPRQSSPVFLHLVHEDKDSNGFYFLCLYIGPHESDLKRFQTTFRYTSTGVTKCAIIWPTISYKDALCGAIGQNDIWKCGVRLSRNMLRLIQGNASTTRVDVHIRQVMDSSWLPYDAQWHPTLFK